MLQFGSCRSPRVHEVVQNIGRNGYARASLNKMAENLKFNFQDTHQMCLLNPNKTTTNDEIQLTCNVGLN